MRHRDQIGLIVASLVIFALVGWVCDCREQRLLERGREAAAMAGGLTQENWDAARHADR